MENNFYKKDMIGLIYKSQEEKIDNIIKKVNREVKDELKTINLEKIISESNNYKELQEIFKKIEDNYNIKITKYNEEMYKKGFVDGVNFMLNCFENK